MVDLARAARVSPLIGSADLQDLRIATNSMVAALRLCDYRYSEPYAIGEEDRVFGFQPASQSEEPLHSVKNAMAQFNKSHRRVLEVIDLVPPTGFEFASSIAATQPIPVRKYRPNTAFIIMRMGGDHPEDDDVKDCFKQTFSEFGVKAVRADDIEHQDVITKRILDEISTSEFLAADLTGARPSVYYEVGYAHALGQRPILYRRKGTALHFDLAVHNVPEYENIVDLRAKLRKRLAAMTNKPAKDETEPTGS
jgi:hypothetical protein